VVGANLFFQFTTRISANNQRPTFTALASIDQPATSQTSLTLNWPVATDANLQGYNVFMATSAGFEDLTAPDPQSPTTNAPLVFTGLVAGTTYHFIVRARDADGNQDTNLVEVSGTTLP